MKKYRVNVNGTIASHILGRVGRIYKEEYAILKDKGYGMNDRSIARLLAEHPDVRLVVAVDNGINSVDEIARLRRRGVDVVVMPIPLIIRREKKIRPLRQRATALEADLQAGPAVKPGVLTHVVIIIKQIVVGPERAVPILVYAAMDDALGLKLQSVTVHSASAEAGEIIVLGDLLELFGEHDRPALPSAGRVRPLPLQALAVAGRVQLRRIVVIRVIFVPDKSGNDPVVILVLELEAGIYDPLGARSRLLGAVDVGIVGIRQRHIRKERRTFIEDFYSRFTVQHIRADRRGGEC